MALVKCHSCTKEISEYAKVCPECGANKPLSVNAKVLFSALLIGFAVFIGVPFIHGLKKGMNGDDKKITTSPSNTAPFVYEHVQENISEFCQEEWTKRGVLDRSMFAYCQRKESEGYQNILAVRKKYKEFDWMNDLEAGAANEWTKKGITQYSMVAYTIKKEIDAYFDLSYEMKLGPSSTKISTDMYQSCLEKWSKQYIQWSMVMYCMRK